MTRISFWAGCLAVLGLLWALPAAAEDTPEPFTTDNSPETITVPGMLYGPWLSIYGGFSMEKGDAVKSNGTVKKDASVYLGHINAAGGFGLLDNTLGLSFRTTLDGVGGEQSGFRMANLGTSLRYTFYNNKPVAQAFGLDLDLDNQSFTKFFSADVLRVRPSYIVGLGLWRFSVMPFVGLPMYIDTNKDNDHTAFAKRTIYNWDAAHDFMMGVDYGVPISLNVWRERFLISFDTTGETLFYNKHETTLWVTPGVKLNFGLALLAGVQYMIYTTDDSRKNDQKWQLIIQAGFAF